MNICQTDTPLGPISQADDPLPRLGSAEGVHEIDVAYELRQLFPALLALGQAPHILRDQRDDEGRMLLYGRLFAQELGDLLRTRLSELPSGEVMVIRLDFIRATYDFVEEIVSKLVCDKNRVGPMKGKIVVMCNVEDGTLRSLYHALRRTKDSCMVLDARDAVWQLSYVGHVLPHLITLLDYIRNQGEITSRDVAEHFNYQVADAGTRLKELAEDGMIVRFPSTTREGKLVFKYRFFDPGKVIPPDPKQLTCNAYAL